MSLTTYNFKNVAVTMDGVPVRGFWEGDDVVMIERNSDFATAIVGAAGDATVSYSADKAVKVTLKLQPNSPTHAVLQAKALAAKNGLAAHFPLSVRDTGNGEGGVSTDAVILQAPAPQFGTAAQAREWVLFAADWVESPVVYLEAGEGA
jgi:hypothetical protein